MKLMDDVLALLRQPSSCYIATTMADGSPQLTQTWVDTNGEHIEQLAQKYLGKPYPWFGGRDQVRVIVTIAPARVSGQG